MKFARPSGDGVLIHVLIAVLLMKIESFFKVAGCGETDVALLS